MVFVVSFLLMCCVGGLVWFCCFLLGDLLFALLLLVALDELLGPFWP